MFDVEHHVSSTIPAILKMALSCKIFKLSRHVSNFLGYISTKTNQNQLMTNEAVAKIKRV